MTYIKTNLTGYSRITSGSFPGNDTANRAIGHGLGTTPKMVLFSLSLHYMTMRIIQSGHISYTSHASANIYTLTAADTTNFYVGNTTNYDNTGNGAGITYYWVAIG